MDDFTLLGTRISVIDHKIIKTELKFVFSMVKLPKNTKKSNFDFWSIFSHFWTFFNFISGKHGPKFKIFAKFEFSVSDLPKKSKILPKKLFWPILILLLSFFDSLTYGFRIIAQRFHIGPGRVVSYLIEHMLVHIRVTCVK